MVMTTRELWTVIHGIGFGAIFLVTFAGILAELYTFRSRLLKGAGIQERKWRLIAGTSILALILWITVISGTYLIDPWFHAEPPEGITDLSSYPESFLESQPDLAVWHGFAMEWKEHVAWLAPILMTVVAYIVWRYRGQLAEQRLLRRGVTLTFVLACTAALIAGLIGALVTKVAPVR